MKQHINYYFSKYKIEYLKVFCIFLIGISIAVIFINNSTNNIQKQVKDYIDEKIEIVKNNNERNYNEIFIETLDENAKEIALLTFLSSTIIGLPFAYFIIARKGFSIGYTIASIYATQSTKTAIIFICNSLLLHNIIYMISMFIVVVTGSNFMKSIWKERQNSLKFELCRFIIFLIIAYVICFLSILIKTYISTNLLYLFKKYL